MAGLDYEDWRFRAACVGHDPELWFPDAMADSTFALGVCAGCVVLDACHKAGVGQDGIWGGLLAGDRRRF